MLAVVCSAQPVVERQLRTLLNGIAWFDSAARPSIKVIPIAPRLTIKGQTGTSMDTFDLARMGATTGQGLMWNGTAWAPGAVGLVDSAYNGITKVPWAARVLKLGGPQTENTTIDGVTGSYTFNFSGQSRMVFSIRNAANTITSTLSLGSIASGSSLIVNNTASGWQSRFSLNGTNTCSMSQVETATNNVYRLLCGTGDVRLEYAPFSGTSTFFSVGANAFAYQNMRVRSYGDTVMVASGALGGEIARVDASAWDKNAGNDITTSTTAGGDLDGTYPNPNVDGIQGRPVTSTAPSSGQVLKWNGSAWAPAADDTGAGGITSVVGGTGISVSTVGSVATVTNTGDTNAADDITTSTTAGGDLDGTYPNPNVDGLQGRPVASTAPSSGQVLKWNGSAWAPAVDNDDDAQNLGLSGQSLTISGGTGVTLPIVNVSAGTGIGVSISSGNATVTNTGDTNAGDDLTTSTSFSGDVSGLWNNLQLGANVVTSAEILGNTVTGGDIAAATITAFNIANSAIGANQIATGAVRTDDILDHDVQAVDIDTNAIFAYHVNDYELGSDKMTFTGVTSGAYGSAIQTPSFTTDNAGRLTNAGQTQWSSGVYVVTGGVTYLQLNEWHKVARCSGAGGGLVIGLDANLYEFQEYLLVCDQNDVNTISFQVPSGSVFKFSDVLGGSVTSFTAGEAAHYKLVRDGTTYIITN